MSINSREKGVGAEREFSRLVHDLTGVKLARNLEQSRSGGHDLDAVGDDPSAQSLNRFAIEVKRYGKVTPAMLAAFWLQAQEQAVLAKKVPALAYRADRHEWRVILPLAEVNGDVFGQCGLVSSGRLKSASRRSPP